MGYNLERFSAGTLDVGISARTMDFQGDLVLGIGVYNVSQGMQQGLAPRPGMAPIPGQADSETIAGSRLPGLLASEGSPALGFMNRRKVLGVFAIKLADPTNIANKITAYAWLVTTMESSTEYLDIVISSTVSGVGSTTENASANIYDGFGLKSINGLTVANYLGEAFFPVAGTGGVLGPKRTTMVDYLLYNGDNFCSAILMSVTGSNIPISASWGKATAVGDATHAPSIAFQGNNAGTLMGGVPTEYNLQNFTTASRAMKIFALKTDGTVNIQYSAKFNPSTTTFKKDLFGATIVNLDMSTITATKDSAGVTYSDTVNALVNDPSSVDNSSYKAILVAAKKPVVCIFQDAFRTLPVAAPTVGPGGKTNQWFDLTQNIFQPQTYDGLYTEDGINKKATFPYWPAFVQGTVMGTAYGVALSAANTGVLRANNVYEFTYSIFNKRLNFETNVGVPVKIQTDATDWVGLQLWTPPTPGSKTETVYYDRLVTGVCLDPIFAAADGVIGLAPLSAFMNHLQYRFYYRQQGTYEWLPALAIDMPQLWFYPHTAPLLACTGAIAALPGGQPGGFNDYSPLAKDTYNCVVQYKDRAFWFSEKQINFSLRNNIFVYPGRNSISAVAGEFKGGIIHNYPGQAEQGSRLVIFGTRETYVARFTGQKSQANVQVSADTSAVFNVDGSDLVIDPWTSVTAFSYRSAAVAEGILYWWGPQGVFRDDGVQTPTRISGDLEPNLFSVYDPNKTDQIVANYNNQTKELEWFFTPKVAAGDGEVNTSLIYNTISGNWTRGKYKQQIDWLQSVTVDSNIGTAGYRQVVGTRLNAAATTQRAYYFDQRNRSGDMAPTRDWMVKTVSTPSTGVRRFTLAAGYDATNFATIVVGDFIALQQTLAYGTGMTLGNDMIAAVSAINTGAGTVDITLPTGATLDTSASLTYVSMFPFWQSKVATAGLNGIPYSMPTGYWMPKGVNAYYFWLYCYLLAKMSLWKCDTALGWTLGYRTPTAASLISDTIAFADNSDGNFQVYHPLRPGADNQEGQGLKFVISGNHIGHEWVLQYLEAHGTPITGDTLKRFEG